MANKVPGAARELGMRGLRRCMHAPLAPLRNLKMQAQPKKGPARTQQPEIPPNDGLGSTVKGGGVAPISPKQIFILAWGASGLLCYSLLSNQALPEVTGAGCCKEACLWAIRPPIVYT